MVRKQYVTLTPEEWVRQHTLHYLHLNQGVPMGLIVVEKSLVVNHMSKRADILVYDLKGNPMLLVECKAPAVDLSPKVLEQISRYNLTLQVPYLVVTNGLRHYSFFIDFLAGKTRTLDFFPGWDVLNQSKED